MLRRESKHMTKPCTILVVDDDPDLREALVDILQDLGFAVLSAAHGAAALQIVQQRDARPDLILLDIMMPVMDGPTFAIECKNDPRLAAVPVIVLTAHRDGEWAAKQVKAVAYLAKPLRLENLLAAIQSATGRVEGKPASPDH
jgi:two-component system, chemotaxis family, chemotaxis protein CheY